MPSKMLKPVASMAQVIQTESYFNLPFARNQLDFGLELEVCDEGEYWLTRSLDWLRHKIATYDRLIAGVAGTFRERC